MRIDTDRLADPTVSRNAGQEMAIASSLCHWSIHEIRSFRLVHTGCPFAGTGYRLRPDRMGHDHAVGPHGESRNADRPPIPTRMTARAAGRNLPTGPTRS